MSRLNQIEDRKLEKKRTAVAFWISLCSAVYPNLGRCDRESSLLSYVKRSEQEDGSKFTFANLSDLPGVRLRFTGFV
jgi:hypothetical protein